jgi:hypothetical protein
MDDTERMEKMKYLTLEQAKEIIVACHKILDRVGIDGAERQPCDDPVCTSHLTHRLHEAVSRLHQKTAG